jgi:hypothetical protein
MFHDAWRLERDFFFCPQMNGVDWNAVCRSYERLLPLAGSRNDLNYLIGERSNSHTYVGGGISGRTHDSLRQRRRPSPMSHYREWRIRRIFTFLVISAMRRPCNRPLGSASLASF